MTEATNVVKEAVSKVLALRRLTTESGCITTRTQSQIVRALSPDELIAAAQLLAKSTEASDVAL